MVLEKILESPLDSKEIKGESEEELKSLLECKEIISVNPKGNQP